MSLTADQQNHLQHLKQASTQFLANRKDLKQVDVLSTWKLILTEDEIQKAVSALAAKLSAKFEGEEIVVVCILKGCVYFFVDLTRQLTIPYSTYFIEASSYLNSQTQQENVELLSVLVPSKFRGKKVILLDELFDNGATLSACKQQLVEKVNVAESDIFTCCLFKKDKPVSFPPPDLVGFSCLPDLWVVGYGLDDAQEKRGWPLLFIIPKSEGIPKTSLDVIFDDSLAAKQMYLKLRANVLKSIE